MSAGLLVFVIVKNMKLNGSGTALSNLLLGLMVLFAGSEALVLGYHGNDHIRAILEPRKNLCKLIQRTGALALPVYLVQCFNAGTIGFIIGEKIPFPRSFFVNLILIWGLAVIADMAVNYIVSPSSGSKT